MHRKCIAALLSVVLLSGCSANQLTRPLAKKAIEKMKEFNPHRETFHLSGAQIDCLVREGLLVKYIHQGLASPIAANGHWPNYWVVEGTEKGKSVFGERVTNAVFSPSEFMSSANLVEADVTVLKPTHRVVTEVTGISDAPVLPNAKLVDFVWKTAIEGEFPDAVRRCVTFSSGIKQQALLKLYDDGWRVEQIR